MYERTPLGMDVARRPRVFEEHVRSQGAMTTSETRRFQPGSLAIVVGNPVRLRFPPTASGKHVVFWDLEDQDCGDAIVLSLHITVIGTVQDRDGHSAFLVHKWSPYEPKTPVGVRLPAGVATS